MDAETKEVIAKAELPKLFRDIRLALGLSQEKMSELSGISRVQISYYETADSVPTMATFNKWLSAVTGEIRRLKGTARPWVVKRPWGTNRPRENEWGKNVRKGV